MDRTQSSGPDPKLARRPWLALVIAVWAIGAPDSSLARDGSGPALWADCVVALREAGQGGPPVVLLVSSTGSPESQQLRWSLEGYLAARPAPTVARFAEVPAEAQAALVQRLGVARYPTLLVYRKGAAGLELVAHREGPADARSVVAWLEGLGMLGSPTPAADGQLARADFHHGGQGALPSPQAQAPPPPPYYPQASPPPPTAPPVSQPIYVQAPPQPIAAAVPSTPVIVSPPSQAVVFQPQATNVMIGPTPPPNVTFVQGPQAPPNVALAIPAQSAPPPTFAMAAPPSPSYAPYPMAAPAPQPQPQQSIVGTTAIALLLNNPGLIDALLGAIGRHLAKRGQPRVEMAPSSPAAMMAPASAFAAPAALGATSIPLAQPVQPYLVAPTPDAAPAPPYPPGPYPSPQSPEPPHKGLFHRWGR